MLTSLGKKEVLPYLIDLASPKSDDINSLVLSYLYAKQAYRLSPTTLPILEKFATNLYNLNDYVNALECAEKWFELAGKESSPKSLANMFYLRGMSLFYLGKYENAAESLRKATSELTPSKDNEKLARAKEVLENIQTNQNAFVYNLNYCIEFTLLD